MARTGEIYRTTAETNIKLLLNLDGAEIKINTGIGFFDHMLNSFAFHGGFGLAVEAKGDLEVDGHHTVEDVGIVLGQAFDKALGDRRGVRRFASAYIPMDEALAFCAVDISGRPFLHYDAKFTNQSIGAYDTCLTLEFMRALAFNARLTLHLRLEYGENDHHATEALYKAAARALREAVKIEGVELPSTKKLL